MPEVPTLAEAGVPNYESEIWLGLAVPDKTPASVVKTVNAEVTKLLKSPDVMTSLAEQGILAKGSSPAEMKALVAHDRAKWTKLIKEAGIKPD